MIKIKSPTRVDLAGGTLDMWPLYNVTQSAKTVNLAIDIWTRADLNPRVDGSIEIHSVDLNHKWSFQDIEQFFLDRDDRLNLFKSVIRPFYIQSAHTLKQGFALTTQSESPIGGGLGGSSSLVISIIKAFSQWTGYQFKSAHEMVHWAHNIEAELLMTPTGTQDYYPAVAGGLNYLEYSTFGITQKVFNPADTPLHSHFLLVYTGRSHHSGLNNFEVLKSVVEKDVKVISALNKIKIIADEMAEALQDQRWDLLPELFRREYSARIELTPAFTSPEIEKLVEIGLNNGASAVKICGAGGGGCVLVWVSPENRQKVVHACEKEKFQVLNARPVSPL